MSFTPPSRTEEETAERAREAVRVFRAMLPGLTSYARAITGSKKLRVKMGATKSSSETDGQDIMMRPPIALGDKTPHDRRLCDRRGVDMQLLCPACEIREHVLTLIYHEVSHIAFGTFAPVTDEDAANLTQRAAAEGGTKYAKLVMERLQTIPERVRHNYMTYSSLISEFLPIIFNSMEDARVNARMADVRPGTKRMFEANATKIFTQGIENDDGTVRMWRDAPLNMQAVIGLYCKASGYNYEGYFHEFVTDDLADAELTKITDAVRSAKDSRAVYMLSFQALARLRELGYCKSDRDPEDEEEEQDDEDFPTSAEEPDVPDGEDQDDRVPEDPGQGGDEGDEGEVRDESSPNGAGAEGDPVDEGDDLPEDGLPDDAGEPSDDPSSDEGGDDDDAEGDSGLPSPSGTEDGDAGDGDASGSDAEGDAGDSEAGEPDSPSDGGADPEEELNDGEDGSGGREDRAEAGEDPGEGDEPDDGGDGVEPPPRTEDEGLASDSDSGSGGGAGNPERTQSDGGEGESDSPDQPVDQEDEDATAEPGDDIPGQGHLEPGEGSSDPGEEAPIGDASELGSNEGELSDDSDVTEADGSDDLPVDDAGDDSGGSEDPDLEGGGEDAGGDAGGAAEPQEGAESPADQGGDGDDVGDGDRTEPDDSGEQTPQPPDKVEEGGEAHDIRDQEVEYGDAREVAEVVNKVLGHDPITNEVDAGVPDEAPGETTAVNVAVVQGDYFETPSNIVAGVREHRDGVLSVKVARGMCRAWDRDGWNHLPSWWFGGAMSDAQLGLEGSFEPPEAILGPALLRMRAAFAENKRGRDVNNLKAGKVNARALGKRAWGEDERLFKRRQRHRKKSYFVMIGVDCSGSTVGENIVLAKQAAFAQAELCHRMGIQFAVAFHSGTSDFKGNNLNLDIYWIKEPHEPWTDAKRDLLSKTGPDMSNLDGHTLEFYRKVLDRVQATDKIIMYYTDGKMPAENYDEELFILQREIKVCRQKGYTLVGVGIRTDSPIEHGLDTVQVNEHADIVRVVAHLGRRLEGGVR